MNAWAFFQLLLGYTMFNGIWAWMRSNMRIWNSYHVSYFESFCRTNHLQSINSLKFKIHSNVSNCKINIRTAVFIAGEFWFWFRRNIEYGALSHAIEINYTSKYFDMQILCILVHHPGIKCQKQFCWWYHWLCTARCSNVMQAATGSQINESIEMFETTTWTFRIYV